VKQKRENRVKLQKLKPDENRKSRPFLVWDLETIKWTKFLVGGYFDGEYLKTHTSLTSLYDSLFDFYPGYDCYAHFGGRFDFLFAIDALLPRTDIEFGPIIPRGSGILSMEVTRHRDGVASRLTFRDSSALFPFGLRELTESFGVAHVKQEIDYDKITEVTPQLLEYLEYDLRGLYESIAKFFEWPVIKKAGTSYTIAGQAIRVLRTYLKKDIEFLPEKFDRIIRPAYQGGRVEIFRPVFRGGNGVQLNCYDVNSLYPTVMHENVFPAAFAYESDDFESRSLGFFHCTVEAPKDTYIPILGTVNSDGKYLFPTGRFQGFYSIAEINYARSVGYKIKTSNGYIFESGGRFFKPFVEELYSIKREASKNSVDATIAKLLLNSCYGRFGIRLERENVVIDDGSTGLKPLREVQVLGKWYAFMTKEVELRAFSNVAVAAYVTAYARIFMHRLMDSIHDSLFYTDTDSIFTTAKLPVGENLGELKLEYSCESACFLLPKTYLAGEKVVMKGFDKKKIQHFTMDDFMSCLEGDLKRLKIIQEPKFATFKTAMRSGFIVGMTKESTRQIRSRYDKRELFKDGENWNSRPIHME